MIPAAPSARCLVVCLALTIAAWNPFSRPQVLAAGEVKLGDRTLKVPDGFVVERIAGPPLVDRPITAAFDEQGRLYVADSSGSNDDVQRQLEEKPHRIVRLEDRDGDGVFDQQTVFADRMMFPEGTMWLDGSLYVAAPPSIWKLTDRDGDGVAEERIEWFQGKTLTGCANDLHGPYLGPDGWIYWCKGAFAEQTHERPGKPPFVTRAAHIFRCRPDGTGLEPVLTGGMDNPVDVAFTPGGERILTATFLQHPEGGKRDGLIHAIYGGIYGKVHRPILEPVHRWTAPEVMPVLLHMGPAAPCGLTRLESAGLGEEYRDNLFACYFNLHKVSRHVLTAESSTFTTKDEDFLTSPDLDFHPTDVIEDADGSLIVVDTGGWYKLCCPTSQLAKEDVLGAIYRIRRSDAPRAADPWGLGIAWTTADTESLIRLLDDPRWAVRRRAIETLASRGKERLGLDSIWRAALTGRSSEMRRNALWTLARIDHPKARDAARQSLEIDPDETVRQVAAHSAALWRDEGAVEPLAALLQSAAVANRRVAAEALGRIGSQAPVPALLEAAAAGPSSDRVLEHSITYALIEIGDPTGTAKGLADPRPAVRRAALVALDQMEGGSLDPAEVASLLESGEPILKTTGSWILGRHPEWAGALSDWFRSRLLNPLSRAEDQAELETLLARFAGSSAIQTLLAEQLADPMTTLLVRRSVLKAMAQSGLRDIPESWIDGLAKLLGASDTVLVQEATAAVRALSPVPEKAGSLSPLLRRIARRDDLPDELRLNALLAVPGGLSEVDPPTFSLILSHLDPEQKVTVRTLAVEILTRAQLSSAQLAAIAESLGTVGPLEVEPLLQVFKSSTDEALGLKVVAALEASSALSSLNADSLQKHLAGFGPKVAAAVDQLSARIRARAAEQTARLDELMARLADGDARRGQLVFHSEKAACYSCHAIGYRGGDVGPDLTKVGQIRSERELLEAIVYPSASLIRSYEPVVIATNDGRVINGLIRHESAEEIVVVSGANQAERIARSEIEEIRPSTVSIMPAGLDQQLSVDELADLIAFLKACR